MSKTILNIYVASSWKNKEQQSIVGFLRSKGYNVYDFKNPAEGNNGFSWMEIGNPENWTARQYIDVILPHPIAERGFKFDMDALKWCDACVLVLPCGRSAHLELGWAVGAGKKTVIYLPELEIPELMYKMCSGIVTNLSELGIMLSNLEE